MLPRYDPAWEGESISLGCRVPLFTALQRWSIETTQGEQKIVMKPFFDLDVYAARRARFLEPIEDATIVLSAAPTQIRSHDVEYLYRPSSDLLYLTGFEAPHCVMVLRTGKESPHFAMFIQDRDEEKEQWEGARLSVDGAKQIFGVDEVHPLSTLDEKLPEFIASRRRLYYPLNVNPDMDRRLFSALDGLKGSRTKPNRRPECIADPFRLLHDMRRVKGDEEIAVMRHAADIAAQAHIEAMSTVRPGQMEYQVAARFHYSFQRQGAFELSYPTIVGGGNNATVLHYQQNAHPLQEGTLVLIDAGAEYHYYASDITRTFPVGPRFSPVQRGIYQAVLDVQKMVIAQTRPGTSIEELNRTAQRGLTQALVDLGILSGKVDDLVAEEAYKPFYMHGVGHYLGMDTHDVGTYLLDEDQPRPLEAGVVFTVEPGLYISVDREDVPEEFLGIGVRIEDDVLVTPDGVEVLTSVVPKEIDDIEALRREAFS